MCQVEKTQWCTNCAKSHGRFQETDNEATWKLKERSMVASLKKCFSLRSEG